MDKKEALEILNLDEAATLAEAKKSYRLLAKQYHPDMAAKNLSGKMDTETRMKEINLAFRYLAPLLKLNRAVKRPLKGTPDDACTKEKPAEIRNRGWDLFFKRCEGFLNRLIFSKEKSDVLKRQKQYPERKSGHGRGPFRDVLNKAVSQSVDPERRVSETPQKKIRQKSISPGDYQSYMRLKQKMKPRRSGNTGLSIGRVTKIDPVDGIDAIRND